MGSTSQKLQQNIFLLLHIHKHLYHNRKKIRDKSKRGKVVKIAYFETHVTKLFLIGILTQFTDTVPKAQAMICMSSAGFSLLCVFVSGELFCEMYGCFGSRFTFGCTDRRPAKINRPTLGGATGKSGEK